MTTPTEAERVARGRVYNPPAFPCEAQGDRNVPDAHDYIQTSLHTATFPGMTLRDYFAGQALPAITCICISDTDARDNYAIYCANRAYLFADAMLAVLAALSQEDV